MMTDAGAILRGLSMGCLARGMAGFSELFWLQTLANLQCHSTSGVELLYRLKAVSCGAFSGVINKCP